MASRGKRKRPSRTRDKRNGAKAAGRKAGSANRRTGPARRASPTVRRG